MENKLYGFIKEKNIELPGIISTYKYVRESFAIVEVTEDVFHKLSSLMMDVKMQREDVLEYRNFMKELKCNFLLLIWHEHEEERLYFMSESKRVRALEFIDYLMPEFGLVRGNEKAAGGRISSAILRVKMSENDIETTMEYFLKMSNSYFEDCELIIAADYGIRMEESIKKMERYHKKKIPWAFVKSTDIVAQGEVLRIKSLENESGLQLTADKDVYIMIGARGEVYDIERNKFEKTYDETDGKLDIFEQMLDFLPEVERESDGKFISLDEIAHLCYPKLGTSIYAKELENRTKVFSVIREQEYFLGRPGDYLAVRADDLCDVYIIQGEIFRQTYEPMEK
ncbi:MAG: hypothetical protein E7270_05130 [Lachnospiraceae bacterium]|nr:hypothetical protein [Lachnospiraceae bacterium]